MCMDCMDGTHGPFTKRIVQNDELEVVDLEKLNQTNLLKTRYKDGKLYNETDLKVIRNKVEIN